MLTSPPSKKRAIRDYARRQTVGYYGVFRWKSSNCMDKSECRWYCSYLPWRAYKNYLGVDIDPNKGTYVVPNDFLVSDKLFIYYKQGF